MTNKLEVNLKTYRKSPRLLTEKMMGELAPRGALHPVLAAVAKNPLLRLEIRDRRFNVYYGGGNLMLVDGRKSPYALHFDKKYFKDGVRQPPNLPAQFAGIKNANAWVTAFPDLIVGMDDWWRQHSRAERAHCQEMAAANSGINVSSTTDYLVLDLEYQWARRRFDLIAAKRRPTKDDATGWAEPDLVIIEVKSNLAACEGRSGLGAHASDYRDIITANDGRRMQEIKLEYENVIAQKTRLGLLDKSLGFSRFSATVPEMLLVFVDLDPNEPRLRAPLAEVKEVSGTLGEGARIRFMRLDSKNYVMTSANAVSLERFVALSK